MSETCPCGSGQSYDQCCGPVIAGGPASSPEALMRSRYTAFTKGNIDHLVSTLAPEALKDFNRETPRHGQNKLSGRDWKSARPRVRPLSSLPNSR